MYILGVGLSSGNPFIEVENLKRQYIRAEIAFCLIDVESI